MKIKFKSNEEIQKNIEHIANTNFKKASFLMKISIFILIFDLFTYLIALELSLFDFGLYFEIFSIIFAILSVLNLNKKNLEDSKRNILISTVPLLFLQIYDILVMCINWEDYLYNALYGYIYFEDILALFLLAIIILNLKSYKMINEIGKDLVELGDKDWFYKEL